MFIHGSSRKRTNQASTIGSIKTKKQRATIHDTFMKGAPLLMYSLHPPTPNLAMDGMDVSTSGKLAHPLQCNRLFVHCILVDCCLHHIFLVISSYVVVLSHVRIFWSYHFGAFINLGEGNVLEEWWPRWPLASQAPQGWRDNNIHDSKRCDYQLPRIWKIELRVVSNHTKQLL